MSLNELFTCSLHIPAKLHTVTCILNDDKVHCFETSKEFFYINFKNFLK